MESMVNFIMWLASLPKQRLRLGMALIKLGGGVSDIRGSIGGTVFSKNRYGSYTRNRTIPVNPGSSLQTKIRACASVLRDIWINDLTAKQREGWATYASNVQVQNRLGESITLTGWNMFYRTGANQIYNDLTVSVDAPITFSLAEQDPTVAVTASEATQLVSVAFDTDLPWVSEDDAYMEVYIGRPQNGTINYFKGPYQLAGKIAGDGSTAPTSPATFAVPFAITAGQRVFVQLRVIRADGRLSAPFRVQCDCAA